MSTKVGGKRRTTRKTEGGGVFCSGNKCVEGVSSPSKIIKNDMVDNFKVLLNPGIVVAMINMYSMEIINLLTNTTLTKDNKLSELKIIKQQMDDYKKMVENQNAMSQNDYPTEFEIAVKALKTQNIDVYNIRSKHYSIFNEIYTTALRQLDATEGGKSRKKRTTKKL